MLLLETISQVGIAIFGCSAIWLVGRREHWRRWGYVMGLLGQPFWFYTAIANEQWGITALCFWYLYAWWQGYRNHWHVESCNENIEKT